MPPRYDHVEGVGRVRAYDNKGRSMDRYTVLLEDWPTMDPITFESVDRPKPYGLRTSLAMSEHPQHPQGVGIMDYSYPDVFTLGRRVRFDSLPPDVQRCIRELADA